MSIEWFRSWHGAPTDPKWLLIAKLAMKRSVTQCNTITPGMVSAVVWALFDHASQNTERGRVDDFDVETYSSWSGFEEDDIAAIIAALNDKSVIISGALSSWEKRQPKREDNSTERVRKHRDAMKRNVTQGNDREDKEENREEKNISTRQETRDESFEEFWKVYPRRDGANPKAPAAKLFLAAVRAGTDPKEIIDGARRCAQREAKNVGTPYIPQAMKWLRDKRWMDYGPDVQAQMFDIRSHIIS